MKRLKLELNPQLYPHLWYPLHNWNRLKVRVTFFKLIYLIVCGHYILFHKSKWSLWQHFEEFFQHERSLQTLECFSLCWGWSKKSAKTLVREVETGLDCGWRDVRVFGGIQCCHIVSWLSLPRNYKRCRPSLKMLPCPYWKRARAAVPPLFKCKYLTEPVNRYAINMDPLKGAGAWMLPQGPIGHRVKFWKSNVDPLDQYWLNFAISSSPPPNQCVWPQHVSIWLSASNCDICFSCRQRETCWAFCSSPT